MSIVHKQLNRAGAFISRSRTGTQRRHWRGLLSLIMTAVVLLIAPTAGEAFSVLAHQAVVDQAWDNTLLPLVRQRFPNATKEELSDARSYAHGGSHLADLGYFPLGSRLFTDLLHYVRTGDFVDRLLAEASSPKEYAFALGALDHYDVDTIGHPQATNRAVALIYPKLRRKYGNEVTYADSPSAHLQTEFRFDVLQVARRGEIPGLFQHSIDFKVPRQFVERVFQENYGFKLDDLFENYDVAVATYRWGFRTLIDETTGIAWQLYRKDIESLEPGMTPQHFLHAMSPAQFEQAFGNAFRQPGYFARFIGGFGNLLPNIGPFKRLPYKPLPPKVRQLYADAFQKASEKYRNDAGATARGGLRLVNLNFDTGRPIQLGEYKPADNAYAELLHRHARNHFVQMPNDLAVDILSQFSAGWPKLENEMTTRKRDRILRELYELRSSMQQNSRHASASRKEPDTFKGNKANLYNRAVLARLNNVEKPCF